jgi:hypothetical protein
LRTPTWTEIREFLKYDGWVPDKQRSTDHDYFEKELPDDFLIMDVSRAGSKSMSPGRFKTILADQLRINEAQFWEVLRMKRPAERPTTEPEPQPVSLPLWLARELERRGVTPAEIENLDEAEANALLAGIRSRPRE